MDFWTAKPGGLQVSRAKTQAPRERLSDCPRGPWFREKLITDLTRSFVVAISITGRKKLSLRLALYRGDLSWCLFLKLVLEFHKHKGLVTERSLLHGSIIYVNNFVLLNYLFIFAVEHNRDNYREQL